MNEAGPPGHTEAVGGSSPLSDTLSDPISPGPDKELLPDANTRRRRKRSNGSKLLIEWIVLIVSALTIALLIKTFLFQAFVIPSESMEPTLHGCTGCEDDRILVNKLSYRLHDVNRGDIVVFDAPKGRATDEIKDYVKRVIGLGGEEIESQIQRDNGNLRVTLAVTEPEFLARLMLRLGPTAAVVDPPELRSIALDPARRILDRYGAAAEHQPLGNHQPQGDVGAAERE